MPCTDECSADSVQRERGSTSAINSLPFVHEEMSFPLRRNRQSGRQQEQGQGEEIIRLGVDALEEVPWREWFADVSRVTCTVHAAVRSLGRCDAMRCDANTNEGMSARYLALEGQGRRITRPSGRRPWMMELRNLNFACLHHQHKQLDMKVDPRAFLIPHPLELIPFLRRRFNTDCSMEVDPEVRKEQARQGSHGGGGGCPMRQRAAAMATSTISLCSKTARKKAVLAQSAWPLPFDATQASAIPPTISHDITSIAVSLFQEKTPLTDPDRACACLLPRRERTRANLFAPHIHVGYLSTHPDEHSPGGQTSIAPPQRPPTHGPPHTTPGSHVPERSDHACDTSYSATALLTEVLHFLRCLKDRVHPVATEHRHLPPDELEHDNEALTALSTTSATFNTAAERRCPVASQSEYRPRWLVSAAASRPSPSDNTSSTSIASSCTSGELLPCLPVDMSLRMQASLKLVSERPVRLLSSFAPCWAVKTAVHEGLPSPPPHDAHANKAVHTETLTDHPRTAIAFHC
ncbi:uncharacterized protein MYCFIDRAFT_177100 [Pseudocercospora fijiensis CIRAD86]|uniref:Uncharacterized protein n=1 Tax=Pseudocercospora fijiensis (strain CIRAD86) TaxID=383855 RepID=M3A689_PSEFD|nr:uncharacterized protein MYCFIDRAFT_177100 [Pseudocercospora fijiensis CIRAD86]EME80126.1 hypothetical protein MYCFIDRAFT_177100 [Pseudocercospora fijiensis CIRAD86]